jgi:hypothetical protein
LTCVAYFDSLCQSGWSFIHFVLQQIIP